MNAAWLIALALAAPTPNPTKKPLVSSNGFATLRFNQATARFDRFLQHPYKFESEGVATRDLLEDSYFGVALQSGAKGTWLSEVAVKSAGLIPGTGIIRVEQELPAKPGLLLVTYGFVPRGLGGAGYVLLLEAKNQSGAGVPELSLFSLSNQRLGDQRPEPSGDGEFVRFDRSAMAFLEFGPYGASGAAAAYQAVGGATRRTSGGRSTEGSWVTNPYHLLKDLGGDFTDPMDDAGSDAGYNSNDVTVGFQWPMVSLGSGESAWAGVLVSTDANSQAADALGRLADWRAGLGDPKAILAREIALWSDTDVPLPAAMSADEQALYRQSLATLLMAQVKESGTGHGQILASLAAATSNDGSEWNITWVRDMAYATLALTEAGRFAEAKDALRFQLHARAGKYVAEVGLPYQISVTRYFGDGSEESDFNEHGPNIELDGFGLFLWTLSRYAALSGDAAFVAEYWPLIEAQITDVLVALIEPYTGLIRPDSSIWEVHWQGQQKQFAFTSITAALGVCGAAELALGLGQPDLAMRYRNVARQLRAGLGKHLVDEHGVLAGSVEELRSGQSYFDAAVLEAFASNLLDPRGVTATATLAAVFARLGVGGSESGRGLFRNDSGGDYDRQEWVFINLRAVLAQTLAGQSSDPLWLWTVAQAKVNAWQLSELYDRSESGAQANAYAGSVPMVGFGAGAYLLAAHARYGMAATWQPCGGYSDTVEGREKIVDEILPGEDAAPGAAPGSKKRGCQQATVPHGFWAIASLLSLLALSRRRVP